MDGTLITHGVIQDEDGNMTHHLHPPGETLGEGFGDQEYGKPCIWCARGVPLLPSLRRVTRDGWMQFFDPSGEAIIGPVWVPEAD